MSQTTALHLPVMRTVSYAVEDGGRRRLREERIHERLPVMLETVEAGPIAIRRICQDGMTDRTVLIADGTPLTARSGHWAGLPFDEAATLMERNYEGYHGAHPVSRIEGRDVVDDGRALQEEERRRIEATVVVCDGRAYERHRVPTYGLRIGSTGRVELATMDILGGEVPSWMSFPLSRRGDAFAMAEAVADGLAQVVPDRDWRRSYPKGVSSGQFAVWTVEDAEAFSGLSAEWGGPGTAGGYIRAFARDLVGVLAPNIGHFGDDVVLAFVFLRKAFERDDPQLRMKIEHIVDEIAETAMPETLPEKERHDIVQAVFCLGLRLRAHEPRSEPEGENPNVKFQGP